MKPITSLMFCGSLSLDIQGLVALLGMTLTEVDVIVGMTIIIGHEAAAGVADESEMTLIVR
jgi:hypothetical protein